MRIPHVKAQLMQKIIDYLKEKYKPLAIVSYGSFSCGMNDAFSDFDCMIIVEQKDRSHDDTIIVGIPLDCFIFTRSEVLGEDLDPFLTVYDGNIVLDTDGIAANLKARVRKYVAEHAVMPDDEKEFVISWMRKTLRRMEKKDDEGNYRAIALLEESISDYFRLRDMFYFGSKKAVAYLKEKDPDGYHLYHKAITERTNVAIIQWVHHVMDIK